MKTPRFLLSILLLVTSVLAACAGAYGRTRAYARYDDYKPEDTPFVSLVLRGIADGVSPLDAAAVAAPVEAPTDTELVEVPTAGGDSAVAALVEAPTDGNAPADTEPVEVPAVAAPVEVPADGEAPATGDESAVDEPVEAPAAGTTPPQTAEPWEEAHPVSPDLTPYDDAYYADALFIGDSRTVGLSQYCPGLDQYASFYCQVSLTVFNALSAQIAPAEDGYVSVDEALQNVHFRKIYLMVGINEIGYDLEGYIAQYAAIVNRIRELQPGATIYIQSIMHVSSQKELEAPTFNNAAVNARNERLQALANGTDILYIDLNYKTDDENGALAAFNTFDGVHLTAGAYDLWYQAIKEQTR